MRIKNFKLIGIFFIITSGIIYTLERGFTILSSSIVKAGFFSGRMTGEVPDVEISNMSNNLYIPIFLFLGILFVIYSLIFSKK